MWNSMTSTSFVFTDLDNTMKYGAGFLYNIVFTEWRHCVSQNMWVSHPSNRKTFVWHLYNVGPLLLLLYHNLCRSLKWLDCYFVLLVLADIFIYMFREWRLFRDIIEKVHAILRQLYTKKHSVNTFPRVYDLRRWIAAVCDVSRLGKSLLAVCSTAINLDGEQETTWINWSLNFPLEVRHSDCVLNRPGKSDKGDVRERNSQHIHEIMTQRIYNVSRRCMNVASVPFTCTINFTPSCSSE